MKSRTAVSRTFARVKHRISSIGSLVSIPSESPNPLLAPPAAFASRQVSTATTAPTLVDPDSHLLSSNVDEALTTATDTTSSNLSPIAAIKIATESWTVFNTHPKYQATAYVKFDISCIAQNSGIFFSPSTDITNAGHLQDLSLHLSVTGPGSTLSHYGNLTQSSLHPSRKDTQYHWINLIHIGIKDTSLASKLSTSFRSFSRSASRSIGKSASRLGRYTNVDLINKWLSILEADTDTQENETQLEPVVVCTTVRYKHSLFSPSTELKDRVSCRVKMNRDEMERGVLSSVDLNTEVADSARTRTAMKYNRRVREGGKSDTDEDEEEERVQEARVLGAPWL